LPLLISALKFDSGAVFSLLLEISLKPGRCAVQRLYNTPHAARSTQPTELNRDFGTLNGAQCSQRRTLRR
jgi:hypothetical protein